MLSHDIEWREAVGLVPIVGVILVLAFYPQFVLKRTEPTVKASIAPAQMLSGDPPSVQALADPAGRRTRR